MRNLTKSIKYDKINHKMTKNPNVHQKYALLCKILLTAEDQTMEAALYYEQLERKHALITKIIFKGSNAVSYLLYTTSALFPLAYAIFKFPEPNCWLLPLGYQ